MKKLIVLFSVLFIQLSFAQDVAPVESQDANSNDETLVYNTAGVDVKPEYPGGMEAFYKFILKNYKLPSDKKFKGGKVIVSFVIEKDGYPTEFKILQDPGFGTAEETIRLLKKCKKWEPAHQNGRKVRCYYTLPIALPSN